MKTWIDAVTRCHRAMNDGKNHISKFNILNYDTGNAVKTELKNGSFYLQWRNEEGEFILLVSQSTPAVYEELQDRLENIFDNILEHRKKAHLYALRYVVIDDMLGLEVCGETILEGTSTVFYGIYLSNGELGYYMTGFGDASAEIVFDELCGAARHFYRNPTPATIMKGKTSDKFISALRNLAIETLPDKQLDWNTINLTFMLENGKVLVNPIITLFNQTHVATLNIQDLYKDKDIMETISTFLEHMPYVYDISNFTITNFKDGRYGLTYTPTDAEYLEDNQTELLYSEHQRKNWSTRKQDGTTSNENLTKDYSDLDSWLIKLSNLIIKSFPKNWTQGQGLIILDDETPVPLFLSSHGESFDKINIRKADEKRINDILKELINILENYYPGWNAYVFCFAKTKDSKPDMENIRAEAFHFDVFMDAEEIKSENYGDDEERDGTYSEDYLLPFADLFYDELNGDACVAYVTFKVAIGGDGLFVIEPATAGTAKGIARVKSFNAALPKIASLAEDVFDDFKHTNTVSVTIFPKRKFGFYLEYTQPIIDINRNNLPLVLKEHKLNSYEQKLTPFLRDEILAIIYEVEVESSLTTGVSKLGGSPDLPKGMPYPVNDKSGFYEFVAQINLEETAPFDKEGLLPKKGILSFFYDKKSGQSKVFYFEDKNLEMVIMPKDSGAEEFFPARLRFIPSVSLPVFGQKNIDEDFFDTEEDFEKFLDISEFDGKVKIFGYADAADERNIEEEHDKPLKLLLQVPSLEETNMKWGGEETTEASIYFWIEENDLKNRRFDKVFCVLQKVMG